MRILMTADAAGGVWTYALELAAALAPRGINTTLATMGPLPSADQVAAAAAVPGLELVTSTFKLEWMDDAWTDLTASMEWLRRLADRARPSILHLNGYAHAAAAWDCPVLIVGHSCVASWAAAVGGTFDAAWMTRYRAVVTAGLRAADHVVAPSRAMLAALQHHYGPIERTSVIANGRDPARFRHAAKEPFVLAAGRLWDRAKNIAAVTTIAPQLSWPVVVAGNRGNLECGIGNSEYLNEFRIPDSKFPIAHLGNLSQGDLARWLGRASIFVLPARYEPFGLLPLEAALSGCALVLGNITSLREIWGDAASYVDGDAPDQLKSAIQLLIDDAAMRSKMAHRAYERGLTYSAARMADAYVRLYDTLAGRSRAGRSGCRVAAAVAGAS